MGTGLLLLYLYLSYITADNSTSNSTMESMPYKIPCGDHQMYDSCRQYVNTCSGLISRNTGKCLAGCFCEGDYVRAPDGRCVLRKDCPRVEMLAADSLQSIEECQPDEEYVWCGQCEASCREPAPRCPVGCTRGCLCRPPLVRHYTGHCVREQDCQPRKCPNPDEEYICRYGCEARCKARPCLRERLCRLGCHCKRRLLRSEDGLCVPKDQCFGNNTTIINNFK